MKSKTLRFLLTPLLLVSPLALAGFTGIGVIAPQTVTVLPASKVSTGTETTITCAWSQVGSVQVNTEWDNAKKLAALGWALPGDITLDNVKLKTFSIPVKSSGGKGTVSVQWKAVTPGVHNGTCSVDPDNIANVSGNKTVAFTVTVAQMLSKPGTGPNMTGIHPALPAQPLRPGNAPVMPVKPMGLPDITSLPQLMVGQVPASWGGLVNVDAQQAFSAQNGICQFVVQHTARNAGLSATGSFDSEWHNNLVPGSWSRFWKPVSASGQDTEKDLVSMKPGMNILQLALDSTGKVQESNEGNNQFRLRVNLTGSCGSAPGIVPPPPGAGTGAQPSTRLPAIQRPARVIQR
jgi:hypothetical protein